MTLPAYQLVVNPSRIISSMCYSVLRIEPYAGCSHGCIYCYGRWYRPPSINAPTPFKGIVKLLRKVGKYIQKCGVRCIPFRLSTLSDPFQPLEAIHFLSRNLIDTCLKYEIPLIISTKSTMIASDPWKSLILKLSERNLVLVQITLITLNEAKSRLFEPKAPSPYERLKILEFLGDEGIPTIVRHQPLIPGISDEDELRYFYSELRSANVKGVIVETLRLTKEELEVFYRMIKNDFPPPSEWEPYAPQTPIYKPPLTWRTKMFNELKKLALRNNLLFFTCKEGFFDLHSGICCGIELLNEERYALRPTLYEIWRLTVKHGKIPNIHDVFHYLDEKYIFGKRLRMYPRIIRKGLIQHEKKLLRILENPNELREIVPSLIPFTQR